MNEFGILDRSYNLLLKTMQQTAAIEEAIIFGSRAKGNYSNGSDIDLAIKTTTTNIDVAFDLSVTLNEILPIPYRVDVIDYVTLKHEGLKKHIDTVGKTFYKKSAAPHAI
ncbi:MAG: nucleotidyltransferase domain-containing protein [Ferruginibacter sp.]